jgi:hypothetical protein
VSPFSYMSSKVQNRPSNATVSAGKKSSLKSLRCGNGCGPNLDPIPDFCILCRTESESGLKSGDQLWIPYLISASFSSRIRIRAQVGPAQKHNNRESRFPTTDFINSIAAKPHVLEHGCTHPTKYRPTT